MQEVEELRDRIDQAHRDFLEALEGFDDTTRETQPICGVWSARDVAGHLADWQTEMVEAVRRLRAGEQPKRFIRDIDAWNHDQAAVRGIQTWADAEADLIDSWQKVIESLEQIDEDEFHRIGPLPWGTVDRIGGFYRRIARHSRAHADEAQAWRMRKLGVREREE